MSTESTKSAPESVDQVGLALVDGQERSIQLREMMVKLGVTWTVRLHPDDFLQAQQILDSEKTFTHFNLGKTIHKVGEEYALVKIVKSGASDRPPLIDYTQAVSVKCSRVLDEVSYLDISSSDYRFSLPNIQSRSELERAMCNRYCSVRNLTETAVLNMTVTLTEFKLS